MELDLLVFDSEWKTGDRELAKVVARDYVTAHEQELAYLEKYTQEDLVKLIDKAREDKDEERRILLDMWLLAKFDPQLIVGGVNLSREDVMAEFEQALKEWARN